MVRWDRWCQVQEVGHGMVEDQQDWSFARMKVGEEVCKQEAGRGDSWSNHTGDHLGQVKER